VIESAVIFALAALVGYLARELRQARAYRKRWRTVVALLGELESENRDLAIGAGVFNEFDRMELRKKVAAAEQEKLATTAGRRLARDLEAYEKVLATEYKPRRGRHHWS
jgi:glutamyl/glutaminyl-tRNA synthetase